MNEKNNICQEINALILNKGYYLVKNQRPDKSGRYFCALKMPDQFYLPDLSRTEDAE